MNPPEEEQKGNPEAEAKPLEEDKKKNLCTNPEVKQLLVPDERLKKWLLELVEKDVQRAKESNTNPMLLKVNNMAIIRRQQVIHNRVEFDTLLDFKTVEEILISEEVPCEFEENLFYITVVLFGRNKKVPIVFPYCYRTITSEEEEQINKEKEALKGLEKNQKKKKMKKLKKKMEKNDLSHWLFVNNKGEESAHTVSGFKKI